MKKIPLLLVSLLAGAVPAVSAQAACVQADAAGRWSVYSMNSDDDVVRCAVTVNAYGTIARTTCTGYYGSSSATVPMAGGKITLSDTLRCSFRGSITFNGVVNTIREMSLSPNKQVAQGIGTFPGGSFFLSMTRY